MAEYVVQQVIFPGDEIPFFEESDTWSQNLLDKYSVGFVRQLGIHAMPGTVFYIGPRLISPQNLNKEEALTVGPSGIFQLNTNEGYLIQDIRLFRQSYDNVVSNGQFIVLDLIGTHSPGNGEENYVIYNGGGVDING